MPCPRAGWPLQASTLQPFLSSPIIEVHDLSDAFSWGHHHLDKLIRPNAMDINTLIETLSGRTLSLSNSFNGIGDDMIATDILQNNYKATTQHTAQETERTEQQGPLKFPHKFCVECDNKCHEELLALIPTDQDTRIFGNIMDFTPNNIREAAGLNQKTALAPAVFFFFLQVANTGTLQRSPRGVSEPADIHSASGSRS